MLKTPRLRRIRHQKLSRQRRGPFAEWMNEQASRLGVPTRVVRDQLRTLGPSTPAEIEAAADAAAAGIMFSTAATVDFVAATRKVVRAAGSFVTDGFVVGGRVLVGGAGLNVGREAPIAAVTALEITLDGPVVDETGVAAVLYKVSPVGQ